jgi:peptidoglycan/xylan/chitin deacetylase (PgdA/CDA1 family)
VRRPRPLTLLYHGVSEDWDDELAVRRTALDAQVGMAIARGYRPVAAAELVGTDEKVFHVTFDDAYRNIGEAARSLVAKGVPVTVFACAGFADVGRKLDVERLIGGGGDVARETMTWAELRDLAAAGVEIGSHTISHPRLTRLSDVELREELGGSKEMLEAGLERPCPYLAYPFGDHDARVRAATREAGYLTAFATTGRYKPFDRFAIPRAAFYRSDSSLRVALKVSLLAPVIARARESQRERAL